MEADAVGLLMSGTVKKLGLLIIPLETPWLKAWTCSHMQKRKAEDFHWPVSMMLQAAWPNKMRAMAAPE
jgi:hypothetical protein